MIPKIVHYAWFGGAPKPPVIQRCMESWCTHLPDYFIQEWNEANFNCNQNLYVRAAYDSKRWAFVSDVVRLWALWNHGGVYMDVDVEVVQPLDKFLVHRAFTGHETDDLLVTATMGSEPRHNWIKMLLNYYDNAKFDGVTPNTHTITDLSQPWIERRESDGSCYLREGVVIYPRDVFCPYDHVNLRPTPTENTYCIHKFCGSWLNEGKGRAV